MVDASVLEGIREAHRATSTMVQNAHREFADIENTSIVAPTSVATAPYNQHKNRYNNVLPFDHNLVELPLIAQRSKFGLQPADPNNYINGSWIRDAWLHGESAEPEMVVTQGPLPQTVPEFWRLVAWLPEPRKVVMLTDFAEGGVDKCAKYLPHSDRPMKFKGGAVALRGMEDLNHDITRRILILQLHGMPVIEMEHYHYHKWPDHGTPDMRLMSDLVMKMGIIAGTKAVPLVHCSAGIGRTGCFAVHLLMMRRLNHLLHRELSDGCWSKAMEVGKTVRMLRQQRGGMVQTPEQFEFCYRAALDVLSAGLRYLSAPSTPGQAEHTVPNEHGVKTGAQRGSLTTSFRASDSNSRESDKWEGCLAPLLNRRARRSGASEQRLGTDCHKGRPAERHGTQETCLTCR